MSLPTVDEGLGFITYDTVATNSALLSKQQSDLSGNETQRQFCIDAFHLAGNRDVSNALIVSDDITTETDNVLAFIGSNVKSVQRTYLSNINISTKNQLFAINAYDMTYGISKLNPLNSKFLVALPFTQLTETKIVANDRQQDDLFGHSVAISGNYVIVGAYGEDHDATGTSASTIDQANYQSNTGSAYIFEIDTNGNWNQVQKIVSSDRQMNDFFGRSVAISGNYAIVGAYYESHDATGTSASTTDQANHEEKSGSAYIFENTNGNWSQVQKIVANDRQQDDYFGYSVAIDGSYAIVGAYWEDHDATGTSASTTDQANYQSRAGSAYIFENTNGNWNQVQKIVANDRQQFDYFGRSVAISGNYAIVAAYGKDHDASGNPVEEGEIYTFEGAAYIFERDTNGNWSQKQKILANDRQNDDYFGYSVAISGNYAIVGAQYEDHDASGNTLKKGAAYIFERDTNGNWSQVQKIVANDRQNDDRFGVSVAISGNYAIVGAYFEDHDATGTSASTTDQANHEEKTGSAYIFERDTNGNWSQVQKIVANDRQNDDRFGTSVAISGNYAIVGASSEDHDATGTSASTTDQANYQSRAGAAYIFKG